VRHVRDHRLEAAAAKNRGVTLASLYRQRLVFPLDYVCPLKRGRTDLNWIVEAQEAITTRPRRGSRANTEPNRAIRSADPRAVFRRDKRESCVTKV
jgi:hypothetical protein